MSVRSLRLIAGLSLALAVGGALLVSALRTHAPVLVEDLRAEEDPVARALFDSGKEALSKRRYDDAVRFFRKALDESSDLIEAAYWEAQAHEKTKQTSAALAAYRDYVALFLEKKALDEVSKTETSLHGKALGRIEKLAAGERALDDLQSAFVTKLLAFADNHQEDDPAVAREALKTVLIVDPEDADARMRWADLGGGDDEGDAGVAPATKAPTGPFERLKKGPWHDYIAGKTLGTSVAKYEGDSMFVDAKTGKILQPTERVRTGERFVVDMDFRVLEEHESSWLVGIVVGWEGEEFYSAFTQRGQVVLNRGHAKQGPLEDIEQHPMKPIDPKRWHRLSVRVEGRAMVVWFDGDVVCRTEVDDPKALQGEVCLFHQRCKAEYRLLQVAELE